MRSVGAFEFQAFEEWRAMAAAVDTEAEESGEDEGEWDDQGYALGAIALPLEGAAHGKQVAATGTKAGAEKARVTRAAGKGKAPDGVRDAGVTVSRPAGRVGTALIARPVDVAATRTLQGRRDKAAAKERLAKLPDHGRQVAPQGLNKLPAGFPVRTSTSQSPGAAAGAVTAVSAVRPVPSAGVGHRDNQLRWDLRVSGQPSRVLRCRVPGMGQPWREWSKFGWGLSWKWPSGPSWTWRGSQP
jgi:hypothetical protein